eukprot:m.109615 g.109615  ORF g.109615 m.109615 type:complete len:778 (+) comp14008_c0_seq1:186-2519(+)
MAQNKGLQAAATMAGGKIKVVELVSTCIEVVEAACGLIRDIADAAKDGKSLDIIDKATPQKNDKVGSAFVGSEDVSVEDPQTVADRNAQLLIVGSLANTWPGLAILGEEEGLSGSVGVITPSKTCKHVNNVHFPKDLDAVDVAKLSIWVDPVDGTREFTQGRLEMVTCLVGIAMDGHPLAGVIGQPFREIHGSRGHIVWGCRGAGVHGIGAPLSRTDGLIVTSTRSRPTQALQDALEVINPCENLKSGGAGNKVLLVIEGHADVWLQAGPGTSRWDTCAGQALLEESGGGLTDLNGNQYAYGPDERLIPGNKEGVVAWGSRGTSYLDIIRLATCNLSTWDILRTPTGEKFTVNWMQNILKQAGFDSTICDNLVSFNTRETTSIRSRHSSATRIALQFKSEQVQANVPVAIFLKRCVLQDLLSTFPRDEAKTKRDSASYNNEVLFYRDFSKGLDGDNKDLAVKVPNCFYTFIEHDADRPAECKYMSMTECLDDYEHKSTQCGLDIRASLVLLAKFHANFFGKEHILNGCKLWDQGGHWNVAKRPKMEMESLEKTFGAFVERFRGSHAVFDSDLSSLGTNLQHNTQTLADRINMVPTHHKTIIHGDCKTANIFFRKGVEVTQEMFESRSVPLALIDFQWSGVGLGAQDVIYLLVTSADAKVLNQENELLELYHSTLIKCLQQQGYKHEYTFEQFLDHYSICCLDYFRFLFAYPLKAATPESVAKAEGDHTLGMFRRSLDNMSWLINKARPYSHFITFLNFDIFFCFQKAKALEPQLSRL